MGVGTRASDSASGTVTERGCGWRACEPGNRRGTEAPPGPHHQLHFSQVNPNAGTPGRGDTSHLLSVPPSLPCHAFTGVPLQHATSETRPRFSSWIDGKCLENSSIPDQSPMAKEFSVSALENGQEGCRAAGSSPDALCLRGHIPVSACPDSVFRPRCICQPSPGQRRSQAVPHGRVAGRPPSGRPWGLGVYGPPTEVIAHVNLRSPVAHRVCSLSGCCARCARVRA